jgi:Ca2+:H+ antiporter
MASRRDKLDLAINVALGSALQISLGVLPFLVILSTLVFKAEPLTLIFPATYVISLIGSVMLITIVTIHDNTDWMKGAAIIAVYLIIALSYWYSS